MARFHAAGNGTVEFIRIRENMRASACYPDFFFTGRSKSVGGHVGAACGDAEVRCEEALDCYAVVCAEDFVGF